LSCTDCATCISSHVCCHVGLSTAPLLLELTSCCPPASLGAQRSCCMLASAFWQPSVLLCWHAGLALWQCEVLGTDRRLCIHTGKALLTYRPRSQSPRLYVQDACACKVRCRKPRSAWSLTVCLSATAVPQNRTWQTLRMHHMHDSQQQPSISPGLPRGRACPQVSCDAAMRRSAW
jgi:hypothetical protein